MFFLSAAAESAAPSSFSDFSSIVPVEAKRYAELGYYRKALRILEPVMNAGPENADILCFYGYLQAMTGTHDDGIRSIRRAISINPNKGIYHRCLGEAYGEKAKHSMDLLGMFSIYSTMKTVASEFRLATELSPGDIRSRELLATFYIIAPGIIGGSVKKARAEIDIIRRVDEIRALHLLAMIAQKNDETAQQESLLLRASEKDTTAESLIATGIFYTNQQRFTDAFAAFRTAHRLFPHAITVWYQFGRTAGISGTNIDEGITLLRQYLSVTDLPDHVSSHAWAHFRLGYLFERKGLIPEALEEYRIAGLKKTTEKELSSKISDAIDRLR